MELDHTLAPPDRSANGISSQGSTSDELARGDLVGRYLVLGKIGMGAMGVVYAAHDPELDRKLALKMLLPGAGTTPGAAGRVRLLREAQALAKLSHPNVVAVHDVGVHGDAVWIAMEFVAGKTLSEWAREKQRRWPDIVRVLAEVARGLSAVHNQGVIHRDLKPENVMVSSDGRVRVMDFGLAHGRTLSSSDLTTAGGFLDTVAQPEMDALMLRLTRTGTVQGTPGYMAPEQWRGQEVEAKSDQFAWSVMAWEMLYGERPFAGQTLIELVANVIAGRRSQPTKGRRVPAWVRRVVERGLSAQPSQRWPTMDELLAALERNPRRQQVRVLIGVGVIAASIAGYMAARTQEHGRCAGLERELAGVWDSERKADVARAFTATGVPGIDEITFRVEQRLENYASTWTGALRSACEAHATGTQSSHLMDLRVACLNRHRTHLTVLVDTFASADRDVLGKAVEAIVALPSIASCNNTEDLLAVVPPDDPATAQRVDALRERLVRARVMEATGRYAEGVEVAALLYAEAKDLGYAPLIAEAALVNGSLLMMESRFPEADESLQEATSIGLQSDLHGVAAEAITKRIFALGNLPGKYADALALRTIADALVRRAHDDGRLAALLANNLGTAHDMQGEYDAAHSAYEEAIAIIAKHPDPRDPLLAVVHFNLSTMENGRRNFKSARLHANEAIDLWSETFGHNHPMIAAGLATICYVDLREGMYADAERRCKRSLRLLSLAYRKNHPYLAYPLTGLGTAYAMTGRDFEARELYQRALTLDGIDDYPDLMAGALLGLAELEAKEDPALARSTLDRAIAIVEKKLGPRNAELVEPALAAGRLAASMGDHTAAIGWFERVLALPRVSNDGDRGRAAAGLANELARGGDLARACELLTNARDLLPADDPVRTNADALYTARCAASG